MVSPFTKDMASPRSKTSDMYNHAREIIATDIFAASESFNICLLEKKNVQTDLKKVGGNATGLANIKIAAVSMLVGEEYAAVRLWSATLHCVSKHLFDLFGGQI